VQQRLGALSRLRVALAIGALVARLVSVEASGVSFGELRLALRDPSRWRRSRAIPIPGWR